MNKLSNFIANYGSYLPPEALNELKKIELDLSEVNYMNSLFSSFPSAISIVDKNGTYLKVNPKMQELVGEKNLIGSKIGDFSKDDNLIKIISEMYSKNQSYKTYTMETFLNDSPKTFLITINKVKELFVVIGADVSDFKNLEEDRELNEKMAFLGEMTASIVHEINNPLQTISLANDQIQVLTDNQQIVQNTEKVIEMIELISKIIKGLKTFARQNEEEEYISVNDLLDKSQTVLIGKLKNSHIKILTENLDELVLPGIEVDYLQVMVNLLSNSIDAVKDKDPSSRWIKIAWDEKNYCLRFIDSGLGIPEKIQTKMFEKFFSSKGSKGNGIGLFLSKKMLKRCRIDLEYETFEGNTCFKWSLSREVSIQPEDQSLAG